MNNFLPTNEPQIAKAVCLRPVRIKGRNVIVHLKLLAQLISGGAIVIIITKLENLRGTGCPPS